MEARLAALEAAHQDTREKLVRIETRLDAVATTTDISDLRGEIQGMQVRLHQEINAQTWKLVTFVCSFGTALVAATYFIAKHVS